jgi:hypothetical protein
MQPDHEAERRDHARGQPETDTGFERLLHREQPIEVLAPSN